MRTYTSIALIGLALAGVSASALADDTTISNNGAGPYVSLQAGQSRWSINGSNNANEFSWGANGGYRWGLTSNQSLGVELGYMDLGRARYNNPFSTTAYSNHAVTLGGVYRYSLTNSPVFFEGRAGYARWYGNASQNIYDVSYAHASGSGNGYYGGLGVGYNLTPRTSLILASEDLRENKVYGNNHINNVVTTLGYEYRF